MIVKNEEKHLQNCLDHLKKLMDNVSSELIIADTGSSDATISIARKFTSNVLEVPWNNDFAEARNHTLRAAKGEWFMFIDADEYLEDEKDLIAFFSTNKHEEYNSASYIQRNFMDDDNYLDSPCVRIHRKTPNLKFVDAVHERFNEGSEPVCILDSYVRHFGYYSEPDLIMRKIARNLPILEKLHENDPTKLEYIRSLGQSYGTLGELDKAEFYIKKGIELVNKDNKNLFIHHFYNRLADLYIERSIKNGDKSDLHLAIETIDEYIQLKEKPSISSSTALSIKGTALSLLDKHEEALECFLESHKLETDFVNNRIAIDELLLVGHSRHSSREGMRQLFFCIVDCYKNLDDFKNAFKWMSSLPVDTEETLERWVHLLISADKGSKLGELYQMIIKHEKENIALNDKLLVKFDSMLFTDMNPLEVVSPFFDLYIEKTVKRLLRSNSNHDELLSSDLPNLYKIALHLYLFDRSLKLKSVVSAMKHIKAALAVDNNLSHLIEPRYNALNELVKKQ